MYTIIPIILFIIHLISCALIYLGIELNILKLKRYILPFIIFVPLSGIICCLILHLFIRTDNRIVPSIEKMDNNQNIFHNIVIENKGSHEAVIPLEEALIVNDAKTRRNLIMNVLNDNPEKYVDVLMQARMNEDTEVVHYATTSMVELSKSYDDQLRRLEEKSARNPNNKNTLKEFCNFLKTYLSQGIANGKVLTELRERYSQLLVQRLHKTENLDLFAELTENEMNLKHFDKAEVLLNRMEQQWRQDEKYQILLLRYYMETKNGEKIQQLISYIDENNIYITQENRKKLDYWRNPEYAEDKANT